MATDLYTHAFADNLRLAKSKRLAAPANGTYNLIRLPRYAFVKQVWLWVVTAYSAAGASVTVGFIGNGETADPDAFLTNTESDPDAAGMKTSLGGSAACAAGKYFADGSGAITLTTNKSTGDAGVVYVFADYVVIY